MIAGIPMAIIPSGTSFVTTAPAATRAPFPIRMPGRTVAFAPITALSSTTGPFSTGFQVGGYRSFVSTAEGPMKTPSPISV